MSHADRFRRPVAAAAVVAGAIAANACAPATPPRRCSTRLLARRARRGRTSRRELCGRARPPRSRARPRRGIAPIAWSDAAYPAALAAIVDPPPVLWMRGVARRARARPRWRSSDRAPASPYALAVAERLAADLAARGMVVVSGLARGVDSAAHRGALAGGGTTIAVLGSGADVIYPPRARGARARDRRARRAS